MPPEREFPWICSQLGAREHYAIPRALNRAGRLRELHTDLWSFGPWQTCRFFGAPGRDLAGRFAPDLPRALVRSYPWQGLPLAIRTRLASRRSSLRPCYVNVNGSTARLPAIAPSAGPSVFFSYTGTFLETAERLKSDGGFQILGQVDPAGVEEEIVARERGRWAGWEPEGAVVPDAFQRHRRAEWKAANLIVGEFRLGEPSPDSTGSPQIQATRRSPGLCRPDDSPQASFPNPPVARRLAGSGVILRKGIQYLCEAARLLLDEPVDFRIVGPIGISAEAVASAPANVRFDGSISRSLVNEVYGNADVFVLPDLVRRFRHHPVGSHGSRVAGDRDPLLRRSRRAREERPNRPSRQTPPPLPRPSWTSPAIETGSNTSRRKPGSTRGNSDSTG